MGTAAISLLLLRPYRLLLPMHNHWTGLLSVTALFLSFLEASLSFTFRTTHHSRVLCIAQWVAVSVVALSLIADGCARASCCLSPSLHRSPCVCHHFVSAMPRKNKRARKQSPTAAATHTAALTTDVHFPPSRLSDFVIHYRGTSYHVHKFVLDYHSSYFRAYIETLTSGQRVYQEDECSEHSDIDHCIRLPDTCGKLEADGGDFQLFLCHLYFARHYSCIPYEVPTDIDLDAQPPPAVTLDYPNFSSLKQLDKATCSRFSESKPPAAYDAVMSLCHYFDCVVVLERAEANCLLAAKGSEEQRESDRYCRCGCCSGSDEDMNIDYAKEWNSVWPCFVLAQQFDMKRVKAACVPVLVQHSLLQSRHKEEWESVRAQLDKDTLFELMQATYAASAEYDGRRA